MISTIFGISLVVNSIRAGIERLPRIGPRTSPRNRSMIVHEAPPTTCRNISGHSLLEAIAAITSANTTAMIGRPLRGTIWKSGRAIGGAAASGDATPPPAETTPPGATARSLIPKKVHLSGDGRQPLLWGADRAAPG